MAGRWLKTLSDGSKELVVLVDADGTLQFIGGGQASQRLFGFEELELAARPATDLVHPDDELRILKDFRELASTPGDTRSAEFRVRHRSGAWVRVESTAQNRLDDPLIGAIVIHTRESVSPEALSASYLNPVTQLPTRLPFAEAVTKSVVRAQAEATYGFSVLIVDLDKLKMLVGTYGQDVVDELINEVGRRLASVLKPNDTLAHLGPGEFAILLDGLRDRVHAARIADRIQKSLAVRYRIREHTIAPSAIVGIATSERRYERSEDVIRDAALAASRARGPGARRAVFQTQMRVEDNRYMQILSGLYTALQGNQFKLLYQPIVDLKTGSLAGFEALIRWYHPEHGVISPMSFIPVAEETGLIVPIGLWVMQEATRQLSRWNEITPADDRLYMSVNLSAKQVVEEDIHALIEAAVAESGIAPSQLKLEVTETAVLDNQENASEVIRKIKSSGVRVSLDDFGTGYSSFSYLHQMPYDTLKVDRSFVTRLEEGDESNEIVNAIIVLAHNLRMDVVAEGVETPRQVAKLRNMACEYAQGYYFAKPMSAEEASHLITQRPRW
ncbi:MAG: GGDEF domain-containing protein [Deltaproteobacteria bacterium]|nr:GGDEF domain-containing protein [Deltaproteobacteria bacterium]